MKSHQVRRYRNWYDFSLAGYRYVATVGKEMIILGVSSFIRSSYGAVFLRIRVEKGEGGVVSYPFYNNRIRHNYEKKKKKVRRATETY